MSLEDSCIADALIRNHKMLHCCVLFTCLQITTHSAIGVDLGFEKGKSPESPQWVPGTKKKRDRRKILSPL